MQWIRELWRCARSCRDPFIWGSWCLIILGILTRTWIYIFHKDMWRDEAYLVDALFHGNLLSIISGDLSFDIYPLSAPLTFLLSAKALISLIGENDYILYFIPWIISCLSLFALYDVCRRISPDGIFQFFVIFFFLLCEPINYYSGEFKQYIIEVFVTIIFIDYILMLYVKPEFAKNIFSIRSLAFYILCLISANTAIIIITGTFAGIFIYMLFTEKRWFTEISYRNIFLLVIAYGIYYYLCLSFNRDSFMSYWRHNFIPLEPHAMYAYVKTEGISIFKGIFSRASLVVFCGFLLGCLMLFRKAPFLFCVLLGQIITTVALNFGLYPPGFEGVIGSRFLLFLIPTILLVAVYGYALLGRRALMIFAGICRSRMTPRYAGLLVRAATIVAVIVSITFCAEMNIRFCMKKAYFMRQTANLVAAIRHGWRPGDTLLVWRLIDANYRHYARVARLDVPYMVVEKKDHSRAEALARLSGNGTVWILMPPGASHNPDEDSSEFVAELEAACKRLSLKYEKIHELNTVLYKISSPGTGEMPPHGNGTL